MSAGASERREGPPVPSERLGFVTRVAGAITSGSRGRAGRSTARWQHRGELRSKTKSSRGPPADSDSAGFPYECGRGNVPRRLRCRGVPRTGSRCRPFAAANGREARHCRDREPPYSNGAVLRIPAPQGLCAGREATLRSLDRASFKDSSSRATAREFSDPGGRAARAALRAIYGAG